MQVVKALASQRWQPGGGEEDGWCVVQMCGKAWLSLSVQVCCLLSWFLSPRNSRAATCNSGNKLIAHMLLRKQRDKAIHHLHYTCFFVQSSQSTGSLWHCDGDSVPCSKALWHTGFSNESFCICRHYNIGKWWHKAWMWQPNFTRITQK